MWGGGKGGNFANPNIIHKQLHKDFILMENIAMTKLDFSPVPAGFAAAKWNLWEYNIICLLYVYSVLYFHEVM